MNEIIISVIIPCFNCEKTIIKALNSIDAINKESFEIICIDDCSSDGTYDLLENYKKQTNKTIVILKNSFNLGAGKTRNYGVSNARGKYIVFLDSDDYFTCNAIDKMILLANTECDMYVFDAFINPNKRLKMFFTSRFKESGFINNKDCFVYLRGCTCGKMYRRSIVLKNNIYFGDTKINEDLIFTKKATYKSKRIYYLKEGLYVYNMNSNSLMGKYASIDCDFEMIAYSQIKSYIGSDYKSELNSVYFLEVLYAKSLRNMRIRKKFKHSRQEFISLKRMYDAHDMYFKGYVFKYRLAFFALKLMNFSF